MQQLLDSTSRWQESRGREASSLHLSSLPVFSPLIGRIIPRYLLRTLLSFKVTFPALLSSDRLNFFRQARPAVDQAMNYHAR